MGKDAVWESKGCGALQADAGKSLQQWMKEHKLSLTALKQLCDNAEACGWQRPNVRAPVSPVPAQNCVSPPACACPCIFAQH
jgi:hypothetical protein